MGLIKALAGAAGGALGDQWKEFFYCEALPENVLMTKGMQKTSRRSSNTKGSENVITSGSLIAVADGQCMIIVEQGKIVELCADPGEFTYDASTEPSIFTGGLGEGIMKTFQTVGKRFTFGGETPKDQRIYYFNTKELMGNKYGTPSPVPFRVVDQNIGLDVDISIRCFGEYSYRISDPMLFYVNVAGNVAETYERDRIDGQLKTELMTALQPAFAKISDLGVRYSALPGHTEELAKLLNEVLSEKWRLLRGIEIVSFGVSSVKASEEDEAMIKELQRNAVFRNANMAAAHMVGAQASAMQSAAENTSTGPAMAFMGMNMASQAGGMNPAGLFQAGAQQEQAKAEAQRTQEMQAAEAQKAKNAWTCSCGYAGNQGKFCAQCGAPQPKPQELWRCVCGGETSGAFCPECGSPRPVRASESGWTCSCGVVNQGKFCKECGAKKPEEAPGYRCNNCGFEPKDPHHPPKFCPECGDVFDENDAK
ncbi:hypothetical protein ABB02_01593 [Clostridiaceae bacterium JG1575]|nr:hypothetical protein ABB02_01593 [Clostridiaceae bacterium JG1575]